MILLYGFIVRRNADYKANYSVLIGFLFASISVFFLLLHMFPVLNTSILSAFGSSVIYYQGADNLYERELMMAMGKELPFWTFISFYYKEILVGFFVFLLTPHPANYFESFMRERINGLWGIYTDFDNILILLGSVLYYSFIIPLIIKSLHRGERFYEVFLIVVVYILVLYSLFHFGATDPRIKFVFWFYLLVGFKYGDLRIHLISRDYKYYFGSLIVLIVVYFV